MLTLVRKIIFFGAFLLFVSNAIYSQSNVGFDTTAIWREYSYVFNSGTSTSTHRSVYFSGSEVIENTLYSCLKYNYIKSWSTAGCSFCSGSSSDNGVLIGYFRQDTLANKVFIRPHKDSSELLYIDYSVNVGDVYPPNYLNPTNKTFYVIHIDTVNLIGNIPRKRFYLGQSLSDTINPIKTPMLIEGMGSRWGTNVRHLEHQTSQYGNRDEVRCFSTMKTIYPNDADTICKLNIYPVKTGIPVDRVSNLHLYPNPVTDIITINASNRIESLRCFSIQGKEILLNPIINNSEASLNCEKLESGIYFIHVTTNNGFVIKKIIKK